MEANSTPSAQIETTVGELVAAVYQEFLAVYGDPELASLAAATVVNDMLSDAGREPPASQVA